MGKILLVKNKKNGKFYAMKSMRKDQLLSEGITNNILIEKNILTKSHCEFIMTLDSFFQTPERIYYICPFIKGGDLFHKLKQDIFFKEDLVRFYTAQVAIALQHIHDLGFAYRDLKPENILINEDGYIKLCDFGSCVNISGTRKETSFAGSPEYAAPEMITYSGHNIMCDWWSFGILIYELLYGRTPFFNLDKNRMYDLINTGSISYPLFIEIEGEEKPRNYKISEDAKNIISKLLEKDPDNRLGKNGIKEIQKHPFFNSINFEDLKKKKIKAPFKPEIITDNSDLTKNFDEEYLNLEIAESPTAEWAKDGTVMICQYLEVLSDEVSNEYLHYCQEKRISYIFAGKNKIDIRTSLVKLKKLCGIDKMVLEGGPTLDGAFISDDLIDAISIIITPCTGEGGETLFKPSKYVEFKLIEFEELSNSNIWLHYVKKK